VAFALTTAASLVAAVAFILVATHIFTRPDKGC
jgi:hypothetical protein